MAIRLNATRDLALPNSDDTKLALESSRKLARLLNSKRRKPVRISIEPDGKPSESLDIPVSAFRILNRVLTEMANGNVVALTLIQAELTTRQAAEILNVSRPFLIEQLEKGLIPFRKVGSHRRILYHEILNYKKSMEQKRGRVLEEMSALDQELGLGY